MDKHKFVKCNCSKDCPCCYMCPEGWGKDHPIHAETVEHCPACASGQSLDAGQGTHLEGTVEHPAQPVEQPYHLVKNKSTEAGKEFWEHVESVASQPVEQSKPQENASWISEVSEDCDLRGRLHDLVHTASHEQIRTMLRAAQPSDPGKVESFRDQAIRDVAEYSRHTVETVSGVCDCAMTPEARLIRYMVDQREMALALQKRVGELEAMLRNGVRDLSTPDRLWWKKEAESMLQKGSR